VTPAVTIPSSTHAVKLDFVNADGRGRTITKKIAPAQISRSHAAPSAPIRSMSPTETARPSCTHVIDASAIPAPMAAGLRVTPVI
jgi:hypothetical protein